MELERLKSDFISRVSHELRTPITIINGFLETLLAHDDRLDREQRRPHARALARRGHPPRRPHRGAADPEPHRGRGAHPAPRAGAARAHCSTGARSRAAEPDQVLISARGRPVIAPTARCCSRALGLLVDNAVKYGGGRRADRPTPWAIAGSSRSAIAVLGSRRHARHRLRDVHPLADERVDPGPRCRARHRPHARSRSSTGPSRSTTTTPVPARSCACRCPLSERPARPAQGRSPSTTMEAHARPPLGGDLVGDHEGRARQRSRRARPSSVGSSTRSPPTRSRWRCATTQPDGSHPAVDLRRATPSSVAAAAAYAALASGWSPATGSC